MKTINHGLFGALLLLATQVNASPYPLGSMTCDDIGTFASQAMQWREDGMTIPQAKAKLEELKPEDSVEKLNMTNVMRLVFGGYGDSWTVESAGNIMRTDCETGR
jgi:hypothetical protein